MKARKSLFSLSIVSVLLCSTTALPSTPAEDDVREAREQSAKASRIMNEIMSAPDKGIPQDLVDAAECVAVFPSVIKAAFFLGGKGGKGLVSCRNATTRAWGPPVFLKIGGGSFGFQFGAEATDLVLLGMNRGAIEMFEKDRFELGGEGSITAGPVGRSASASTDLPTFRSQFLSYSRSRGAFAGIALKGSVISRDSDLNEAVYGRDVALGRVLRGHVSTPSTVTVFPRTLARYSAK